jgi:hypothetical protein
MRGKIVRWLQHTVTAPSFQILLPKVPGCERFLRSRGIHAIPDPMVPGIIGVAQIDGLLNEWLKEHRTKDLRNNDAESEHELRDLLARLGVPVRPYKGPGTVRKQESGRR